MRNLEGYRDPTAGAAMIDRKPVKSAKKKPAKKVKQEKKNDDQKKTVYYITPVYTSK